MACAEKLEGSGNNPVELLFLKVADLSPVEYRSVDAPLLLMLIG